MIPLDDAKRTVNRASIYAALLLAVAAFVAFRYEVYRESSVFSLAEYCAYEAPLPFGRRILPALLMHPFVHWLDVPARVACMVLDFACLTTLCLVVARLMRPHARSESALALGAGVLFPLGLAFLVPSRFPVLYAYDMPAAALMAIAVLTAQRGVGASWLAALTCIAALNRPTAALVPLLYVAVNITSLPIGLLVRRVAPALLGFAVVTALLALSHGDAGGHPLPFTHAGQARICRNIDWLLDGAAPLRLLTMMGWLPLLWWALRSRMPAWCRAIEPIAVLLLAQIALLGNLFEPRVFGELIVLLYGPVAFAACAGRLGRVETPLAGRRWLRFGSLIALGLSVGLCALCALFIRWGYLT